MKYIKFVVVVLFSLVYAIASASTPDTVIFALPVEEPVSLSANFAELRFNHFHGGLDFRTNGKEGVPVYSIADGYVSKIRIDSKSYGNTIYITHPNGYVSLYSHLLTFSGKINDYMRSVQFERQQNLLEVVVPPGQLPVRRCDVIALSGNTGSSRGPHLHFEIIEIATGKLVNPLKFYPQIKDKRPPVIKNIALYPLDENSKVCNTRASRVFRAYRKTSLQDYTVPSTITAWGNIGFAIQSDDFFSQSFHTFGLYTVRLFMDSVLVYEHKMDNIEPWEQRCINSFIDFPHFMRTRHNFQKSYLEANNKLKIYSKLNQNRGVITFDKPGTHVFMYEVADYHGNTVKMRFTVVSKPPDKIAAPRTQDENYLPCKQRNIRNHAGMKVVFAKDALFTDDEFSCKKDSISRLPNALSAIYTLQDDKTSFRDSVLISIKTKKEVPERYRTKVLIATCNGKYTTPVGGTYDTGYVSTLIKSFARFVVIVDTIAPAVQPLRIYNRAILTTKAGMFFHAWDGLSGIGKFNCWIDDTWVIMYYDMKSRLLSLWFDPERIEYGKWHQCKLVVEDNRGNARTSEFTFYK